MLKKVARLLARLFAATLALLVVTYCALLVVNREDRPPSPDIAALVALQPTTPAIVDEQNAYLYLLGFEAPPGTGPLELGLERHAWMQTADPISTSTPIRSTRAKAWLSLRKSTVFEERARNPRPNVCRSRG